MQRDDLRDKYFLGTITSEELNTLNVELDRDQVFKQEFEKMQDKELELAVKHTSRDNLEAEFIPVIGEWEREIRTERQSIWRNMSLAASVLLIIGIGWYITTINTSASLYDDYYNPYPNTEIMITRDSPDNLQTRAFSAYETADYTTARELFWKMENEEHASYVDFYLGVSLLELGNDDEAISHFEVVIAEKGDYTSEALWYLALAQLRSGDQEAAIRTLNELVIRQDFKEKEALELMEKLN